MHVAHLSLPAEHLADHTDAATTSATAKMIGYPTTNLDLGNHHRPLRPILLGIASLALAVLVGLAPASLAGRGRRRSLRRANVGAAVCVSDPEAVRVTV